MTRITHKKKHDINSDNDHIKNDLDLNGHLSVKPNNPIILAKDNQYEEQSKIWWNTNRRYITFNHHVEVDGSIHLTGENAIMGGVLNNDSVTIRGSRSKSTPKVQIKGVTGIYTTIDKDETEEIRIQDNQLNPEIFFHFRHSKNLLDFPHYFKIGTGWENTRIILDGYVDYVITHEIYAGNNSSDYIHIHSNGEITLHGEARQVRELVHDAYNLLGHGGTYNGVNCDSADTVVIDGFFTAKALNGGTGWTGGPEAFITSFTIPEDFDENEGKISIMIHYTSNITSGSCYVGIGVTPATKYYHRNDTYQTLTIPAPENALDRSNYEVEFDLSNYNLKGGDEVGVVVYRDPDNANDNMNGDIYITGVGLKYIANRIGGKIQ